MRKLAQPPIALDHLRVDTVLIRLLAEQRTRPWTSPSSTNAFGGRIVTSVAMMGSMPLRARSLRHFRVALAHPRQRLRRIVGAEDVVDEAPQHDRARACGDDIGVEARQHLERLLTGNAGVDDRTPSRLASFQLAAYDAPRMTTGRLSFVILPLPRHTFHNASKLTPPRCRRRCHRPRVAASALACCPGVRQRRGPASKPIVGQASGFADPRRQHRHVVHVAFVDRHR